MKGKRKRWRKRWGEVGLVTDDTLCTFTGEDACHEERQHALCDQS